MGRSLLCFQLWIARFASVRISSRRLMVLVHTWWYTRWRSIFARWSSRVCLAHWTSTFPTGNAHVRLTMIPATVRYMYTERPCSQHLLPVVKGAPEATKWV